MRALVFCSVQFLLAVTWTLYVAFLPQLAARAGIAKEHVAWILLMDQVIFIAMDCALGIAADRIADAMERIGGWILGITLVSCAAFILLPRTTSAPVLIGLIAVWAATSSALRAPPMVIIARRMSAPATSFLVSCSVLGIGIAGALAPMLTMRLRNVSPALPFIMASVGLAIAVAALRWIEKSPEPHAADERIAPRAEAHVRTAWLFFAAVWTLALGFQIHTAINSAPAYLKFVPAAELARFMPAFWIGFALCVLLPETAFAKRLPAYAALLGATALGALALFGFAAATSIAGVLAAQCVAGGLWGVIFGTATNAALDAGRTGREGKFTGLVFALSALAAFARIAVVSSGASKNPAVAGLLPWLPPVAWGVAALLLALFVAHNLAWLSARMHAARSVSGG